MNERIRQLAEQAGIHDDVCRMCPIHEIEKFAQLIVAECINIVKNTPKHCAHTTHDIGTVDCTILKSVQSIEQHFNLKHEYK